MMLEVDPTDAFGNVEGGEIVRRLGVAERTLRFVEGLFVDATPLGWRKVQFPSDPLTPFPLTDICNFGCYRIFTNLALGADDGQLVYQLSHECSHLFLGPCRTNFVAETICVAVSHEALEALGYTAYSMQTWSAQMAGPLVPRHPDDIRSRVRGLKAADSTQRAAAVDDRALQTATATLLRAGKPNWRSLCGIAHVSDPPIDPTHPCYEGPVEIDLGRCSDAARLVLSSFGWEA